VKSRLSRPSVAHERRSTTLLRAAASVALLLPGAQTLAQSTTAPAAPRLPTPVTAPELPRVAAPASRLEVAIASGQAGRRVEAIEVRGNSSVSANEILNAVRTRVGEPLDPLTVQEDYQRVYDLRRFSNVEAQLQPTPTGVVVTFVVSEQRIIRGVAVRGNDHIQTPELLEVIDMKAGEGIDQFRIALAKRQIRQFYQTKNYSFAEVTTDAEGLAKDGTLTFVINEGPRVRVRNVDFIGNKTFPEDRLKSAIRTEPYLFILRPGKYDAEQVEGDVAAVRDYYRSKGFFDARVGRRLVFSPDQTEVQVEFLIDEGPRYTIEKVTFVGNTKVSEAELRAKLKLVEGEHFDEEVQTRDVRRIVEAYGPFGFIYEPTQQNPDYLQVKPVQRYRLEPGKIELVYQISEGKQFRVGNIEVRGNTRTQQKVAIREFRELEPGGLWNAASISKARERLSATQLFDNVRITPVGDKPDERDMLVEVEEAKTALLQFGGGVSSNGGVFGSISYTERNFDISDIPTSFDDFTRQRAMTGAGQTLKVSLEPGTENTNASIKFTEPYLFDLPYSFTAEGYFRDRKRDNYDDGRLGGRLTLGKRFNDMWSGSVGVRAEQVRITAIRDEPARAFEILDLEGSSNLTSLSVGVRRDTTNPGLLKYEGSSAQFSVELAGTLGGDYSYQRWKASFDQYNLLYEDLIDRKTVLAFYFDAGYISGDAPFFERFYGGGSPPTEGALRGFSFRGVSPRSGPSDDAIGGDFLLAGTAEISFPVYGDNLRGVVFTDVGTIESDFEISTLRSSVGFGFRVTLPVLGQVPVALDFAWPITRDKLDEESFISFSLGYVP
jgi:outer membrane protein assembly complex protein YaeT